MPGDIWEIKTVTKPKGGKALEEKGEREIPRRLVNLKEAANFLGLSKHSIRRKAHLGDIPYVKSGKGLRYRMLFDLLDLEKWVDRNKIFQF